MGDRRGWRGRGRKKRERRKRVEHLGSFAREGGEWDLNGQRLPWELLNHVGWKLWKSSGKTEEKQNGILKRRKNDGNENIKKGDSANNWTKEKDDVFRCSSSTTTENGHFGVDNVSKSVWYLWIYCDVICCESVYDIQNTMSQITVIE